jgi:hypothetical protein
MKEKIANRKTNALHSEKPPNQTCIQEKTEMKKKTSNADKWEELALIAEKGLDDDDRYRIREHRMLVREAKRYNTIKYRLQNTWEFYNKNYRNSVDKKKFKIACFKELELENNPAANMLFETIWHWTSDDAYDIFLLNIWEMLNHFICVIKKGN